MDERSEQPQETESNHVERVDWESAENTIGWFVNEGTVFVHLPMMNPDVLIVYVVTSKQSTFEVNELDLIPADISDFPKPCRN